MLEKMKAEFEKWHGYSVNDDMDIHTAVAWDSWRIAWNAGAMAATVGLPEVPTCTKSQTAIDWSRVEQAEALDHVTPAIDCECKGPHHLHRYHEWENDEDGNPERCGKCGLSFMRYVHSCCP